MTKILSDENFLNNYVAAAKIYTNNKFDAVYILDNDFNVRYRSQAYCDLLLPDSLLWHDSKLLDDPKYLSEISQDSDGYKFYMKANKQSQIVADKRKACSFLHVDISEHLSVFRIIPIINPSTNNIVGERGTVHPMMMPNIVKLIYKINGVYADNNMSSYHDAGFKLTQRQHLILFLYLNRISSSGISSILKSLGITLSIGTIVKYLENLRNIFNVRTKEELIETAMNMGYHLLFPRELFKPGTYMLEDEILISEK